MVLPHRSRPALGGPGGHGRPLISAGHHPQWGTRAIRAIRSLPRLFVARPPKIVIRNRTTINYFTNWLNPVIYPPVISTVSLPSMACYYGDYGYGSYYDGGYYGGGYYDGGYYGGGYYDPVVTDYPYVDPYYGSAVYADPYYPAGQYVSWYPGSYSHVGWSGLARRFWLRWLNPFGYHRVRFHWKHASLLWNQCWPDLFRTQFCLGLRF